MQIWWALEADQPIEPLAKRVISTVRNEALPRIPEFIAWSIE
jgi:hypothetical protein